MTIGVLITTSVLSLAVERVRKNIKANIAQGSLTTPLLPDNSNRSFVTVNLETEGGLDFQSELDTDPRSFSCQ